MLIVFEKWMKVCVYEQILSRDTVKYNAIPAFRYIRLHTRRTSIMERTLLGLSVRSYLSWGRTGWFSFPEFT